MACTTSAKGCGTTPYLNATIIPLKIAAGGSSVNLDPTYTVVKLVTNSLEYSNIYVGTVNASIATSIKDAFDKAGTSVYISNTINPVDKTAPPSTIAFIYWTVTYSPQNSILDSGEHATLVIGFSSADRLTSLDKIRTEIILSTGATLSVDCDVPTLTGTMTDMG